MNPARILGIDPGGRFVGIVVLERDELHHAEVLDRRKLPPVDGTIAALAVWARHVADRAEQLETDHRCTVVAVEGVKAPNPHVRRAGGCSLTNPAGIIDCAAVFGAIVGRFPAAIEVPPGGNGSAPADVYPPAIGKGARLGGPSDHARSAFDVARRSRWELRLAKAKPNP